MEKLCGTKLKRAKSIIVPGVEYRPPSCNAEDDQVLICTEIEAAQNNMVGNFNFSGIDWTHMAAERLPSLTFLQKTQDN